jgi:ABC-2 type transport system permease protein
MNLFLHEMKMYWKSLLYWSIGIVVMVGSGMAEFTGYYNADSQAMAQFMSKFPKAFLALFGMVNLDVSSLSGYYGILHFYMVVMGCVFAVILGSGILAKEERDKTAEFLLAKPVSRTWVLTQKLLAGMVYVLAFVAVDTLVSLICVRMVAPKEDITHELILLVLSMTLIMTVFYCLAFGLSGILKDNRKASMYMISFLCGGYLGSVFMDLVDKSAWMRPLLLFKYFPTSEIFKTVSLEIEYLGLGFLWIGIGLAMAYIGYPRRDLRL